MVLWLSVLIISIVIEVVTIDLVSIWVSVGSLAALLAYFLNFSLTVQVIVCIVVSLFCIFITRPIAKKYLRGNVVHTNSDRLIGKTALVTKDIEEFSNGEVKIFGNYWTAVTSDNEAIKAGSHVEVLAIDGVKLIVKEI